GEVEGGVPAGGRDLRGGEVVIVARDAHDGERIRPAVPCDKDRAECGGIERIVRRGGGVVDVNVPQPEDRAVAHDPDHVVSAGSVDGVHLPRPGEVAGQRSAAGRSGDV